MLIATPLLKWYLDMGLIVTRVYMVMQFDKRPCVSHVTENAANKRRAADMDSTQKLAGESAKLLANSICGKMCERKSCFKEVTFVNGPTASASVCSSRFRDMTRLDLSGELPPLIYAEGPDMDPESMPLLSDMSPGPCITNVIATCRKNFSQWERSFLWKLRCHWLKFLRRVAKTLVIQGPVLNGDSPVQDQ